jgi:hypothetical protein
MPGRDRLFAAAAGLVPLLLFAGVRDHRFTLDSVHFLTGDSRVREGNLPAIWSGDYWNLQGQRSIAGRQPSLYRPLTLSTLALGVGLSSDAELAEQQSRAVHLLGLLVHVLATVLRTQLLLVLFGGSMAGRLVALLASVLVSVHPVVSEAVGTAVGVAESLSLLFMLAASLLSLRPGRAALAGQALAAWLAMMAKENAVVLPALVGVVLGMRGAGLRALLRGAVPSALGVLLALLQRGLVLGSFTGISEPVLAGFPPGPYLGTALASLAVYGLPAQFWPLRLHPNPGLADFPPAGGLQDPRAVAGLLFLLACLAAAGFGLLGRSTLAAGPWAWLLLWLPTSHLLVPIGALTATRFFYAPLTGWAILLAALGDRASSWRPGARRGLLLLLLLATVAAAVQGRRETAAWASDTVLLETALKRYPESPFLLYNLGTRRAEEALLAPGRGAFLPAIALLEKALARTPPGIPATAGLVPEDSLELAFQAASNLASARMQELGRMPPGSQEFAGQRAAAHAALLAARGTALRGIEQSRPGLARTRWDLLLQDADLALGRFHLALATALPAERQALLQEARRRLEAVVAVGGDEVARLLLAGPLARAEGRPAEVRGELDRVYAEHKGRLASDARYRQLGLERAQVLEALGQHDAALLTRFEVLRAEPAPWPVGAVVDLASRALRSRDLGVRTLAARVLEEALSQGGRRSAAERAELERLRRELGGPALR